jgi:hypothetical protein
LPERPGVDTNRSIQPIGERLTTGRAPRRVTQSRQVGEADRDIDRDHCFLACREWQAERELGIGGAGLLEIERAVESAECKSERVRIRDLRPQSHAGAAKRSSPRRTQQPDFSPLTWCLLEVRRQDERAEPVQLGARLQRRQR